MATVAIAVPDRGARAVGRWTFPRPTILCRDERVGAVKRGRRGRPGERRRGGQVVYQGRLECRRQPGQYRSPPVNWRATSNNAGWIVWHVPWGRVIILSCDCWVHTCSSVLRFLLIR